MADLGSLFLPIWLFNSRLYKIINFTHIYIKTCKMINVVVN